MHLNNSSLIRGTALLVTILAGVIGTGCGSDSQSNPVAGVGGGGRDNATGGSSAGQNSQGGTSAADGAATSTKPQTNLSPTATVTVTKTTGGEELQLVSLNLVPDPAGTLNYIEWFGEVKNTGTTLICFPTATFTFSSNAGAVLWTGTSYADTAPYLNATLSTSVPCLAGGDTGAFWTNDLPTSAIAVSAVASLTVSLNGSAFNDTLFPHTLTAAPIADTIYRDGNHFAMTGSFTPQQTVYNIGIAGYTKSSAGLLTGHLTATNLGTITGGTAWPFTTQTSVVGPQPAKILAYADFILGTSPSVIFSDQAAADAAAAQADLQSSRKKFLDSRNSRNRVLSNP